MLIYDGQINPEDVLVYVLDKITKIPIPVEIPGLPIYIIDSTECKIERPSNWLVQYIYYSGKKKY